MSVSFLLMLTDSVRPSDFIDVSALITSKKSEVPENNLHKSANFESQKKIGQRRGEISAVVFVEYYFCLNRC